MSLNRDQDTAETITETTRQIEDVEQAERNTASAIAMRNFYIIISAYLLFTLTDSALRMIILLELFQRKYNVNIKIMAGIHSLNTIH